MISYYNGPPSGYQTLLRHNIIMCRERFYGFGNIFHVSNNLQMKVNEFDDLMAQHDLANDYLKRLSIVL